MANLKTFMKSGHPPTLFAAFLYFDFSFAVWVLNGAMGPFISEQFHLTPGQIGLMVSVPTLAGALMRFPLGVLSQYIGRKSAAIVEMSAIVLALLYGFFFVRSFDNVLAMGVLLGIAGASFGVALSLGSGWFQSSTKVLPWESLAQATAAPRLRHFWRRGLLCTSAGSGLWVRRAHDAASSRCHDLPRQGATGYRAPDPARTPELPIRS